MFTTQYNEMLANFQVGLISEEVWFDFCSKVLAEIMDDTKDVFVRLKFR